MMKHSIIDRKSIAYKHRGTFWLQWDVLSHS